MAFQNRTEGLDKFQRHLRKGSRAHHRQSSLIHQDTFKDLESKKMTTFQGVYLPVVLSIWGVMVFLRFPQLLAKTGLIGMILLFLISYSITTSTTLSLSAIASNGVVRGGGAYYLISRTVGSEIGGAIGIGKEVPLIAFCPLKEKKTNILLLTLFQFFI